jgi:hypothetical protein
VVVAHGGTPCVYQEYYDANAFSIETPSWYRTPYQLSAGAIPPAGSASTTTGIDTELRAEILALHNAVGNVNTTDRYLVLASGATMLIAAAQYAAQLLHASDSVVAFAAAPYYGGYKAYARVAANVTFSQDATGLNASRVLEYITHPNNPSGVMRGPRYPGAAFSVYDCVYFWPSLVTMPATPLDTEVALFSMSKMAGLAGTRVGWALVRSKAMADAMHAFVSVVQIETSVDALYRTLRTLQHINANRAQFFGFIQKKMRARWQAVQAVFAAQAEPQRFALRSTPGTFYLWVECLHASDANCYDTFLRAGLRGWAGPGFGVSQRFVRLEAVEYDVVFELIVKRLQALML